MPWNLLLVPLVAGYFFLTRSYYYRFRYRLLERQRLLFESIITATVFLVAAYTLVFGLKLLFHPYDWYLGLRSYFPFPYTGTALLSFGLAIFATYVPNILWLSKDKAMREAINLHGNAMEKLVLSAIEYPQLVCFTLDNGKVYVGYPRYLSDLIQTGMLRIYPILSGFRDSQHRIVFTTNYESAYDQIDELDIEQDTVDFEQLIAVDRIISAKRFSLHIYEQFRLEEDPEDEDQI